MGNLAKLLVMLFGVVCSLPVRAADLNSDSLSLCLQKTDAVPEGLAADCAGSVDSIGFSQSLISKDHIWKYKKKIMVGFTTGELDQKKRFGGRISSRWGLSFKTGRIIYLHRRPIGGFLRFGLDIDANVDYMNFAKGTGNISDIWDPMEKEDGGEGNVSLGRHYLTAGVALGPVAVFAPFFASSSMNLASLKFRPYFHVVPSYATYMVSDNDDMELHNAFALWCAAGLEIQWKRLMIGFEWKGCTAKYKGMVDDLMSEMEEGYASEGSYKFDTNMLCFSIGIAL